MEVHHSESEEDTLRIGREIGSRLPVPTTVLLTGELGSGKTVLTKGLAAGLGADPALVHSPSFSLVNQYQGRAGIIYHIDLYRLEGLKELYSIGLEEILASEQIVIIEWAEKLPLEVERPLAIRISMDGKRRRIEISEPQTRA